LLFRTVRIAVEVEGDAVRRVREREAVARDVNEDWRVARAETINRVRATRLRHDGAALVSIGRIWTCFTEAAAKATHSILVRGCAG